MELMCSSAEAKESYVFLGKQFYLLLNWYGFPVREPLTYHTGIANRYAWPILAHQGKPYI